MDRTEVSETVRGWEERLMTEWVELIGLGSVLEKVDCNLGDMVARM